MPANRVSQTALVPVGFQVMSLANSTAIAVNSTCRAANVLDVSVETNDARYRLDAAPTLTTGVCLFAGMTYRFDGFNGTSTFKFQRSTGTCKVSIMAYKHNARNIS